METSIFHVRMPDFELQAERLLDSRLRSRAVAIVSHSGQNGHILGLSREAQEEGLQAGMKVSLLRRMSHGVQILPYNRALYSRMSKYIFHNISQYSPVVEPNAFGQYFVDMSGMDSLYPSQMQAGSIIRRDLIDRVQLRPLVGISRNKLVSDISTQVIPEDVHQVEAGSEAHFLSPLDAFILPSSTDSHVARMFKFLFLRQVNDVQNVFRHSNSGQVVFGRHQRKVEMESRGEDFSKVRPPMKEAHILRQKILNIESNNEDIIHAVLQNLAEEVSFEMRRRRCVSRQLNVEVHYADGYRNARSGAALLNDRHSVSRICQHLFSEANFRRNRLRSIVVEASKLRPFIRQLNLFQPRDEREDNLSDAVDSLRRRFGATAVQSATALFGAEQSRKNPLGRALMVS